MDIRRIDPGIREKHRVPDDVVRQMSDLLGSNMAQLCGAGDDDWQGEESYRKWKSLVFLCLHQGWRATWKKHSVSRDKSDTL